MKKAKEEGYDWAAAAVGRAPRRDADAKRNADFVRLRKALEEIAAVEPDVDGCISDLAMLFRYNAALAKARDIAQRALREGAAHENPPPRHGC